MSDVIAMRCVPVLIPLKDSFEEAPIEWVEGITLRDEFDGKVAEVLGFSVFARVGYEGQVRESGCRGGQCTVSSYQVLLFDGCGNSEPLDESYEETDFENFKWEEHSWVVRDLAWKAALATRIHESQEEY